MKTEAPTDHRDAAFLGVLNGLRRGEPIVVLTNDMGAHGLTAVGEQYPDSVLNVGIQEQNMISVAAGLSACGMTPVVYGISAHMIGRAYEQLKIDLCHARLAAVFLAVGPGLTYASDGPTHQCLHEGALLATLPNLTYYCPTRPADTLKVVEKSLMSPGVTWISLDKKNVILPAVVPSPSPLEWQLAAEGVRVAVVAVGSIVELALEIAAANSAACVQVLRPLPFPSSLASFLQNFEYVLFLEESGPPGVLAAEFITLRNPRLRTQIATVTLGRLTPLGYWTREDARSTLAKEAQSALTRFSALGEDSTLLGRKA